MTVKIDINKINEIGKIIKFHRKYAGISRESLAEISGLGKTSIYDIEKGKETVKIQTLLKVFKALNISIEVNSPIMKNYEGNKNEKS